MPPSPRQSRLVFIHKEERKMPSKMNRKRYIHFLPIYILYTWLDMNDVIQRSFPPPPTLLHNAGDPIPYALIPINKERLTLFVDVTLMGVTQTTVREKKNIIPPFVIFYCTCSNVCMHETQMCQHDTSKQFVLFSCYITRCFSWLIPVSWHNNFLQK